MVGRSLLTPLPQPGASARQHCVTPGVSVYGNVLEHNAQAGTKIALQRQQSITIITAMDDELAPHHAWGQQLATCLQLDSAQGITAAVSHRHMHINASHSRHIMVCSSWGSNRH